MKTFFSFLSLVGLTLASEPFQLEPLSDAEIFYINNVANTTWKAGRNFEESELERVKGMLGVHMEKKAVYNSLFMETKELLPEVTDLPHNFDPRTKWPDCPSLNEIRDQSNCASSWVFAPVEAMTDRICIKYGKSVHISAEDVLQCCACGSGCKGGDYTLVWNFWKVEGIVTGGQYGTNEGCKPYSIPPCDHNTAGQYRPCPADIALTPLCRRECESGYDKSYEQDKHYGSASYKLSSIHDVMLQLFTKGPVTAVLTVYSDFLSYKSGIYKHVSTNSLGTQVVKIIGYGVENLTDYWLVANSWNSDWGDEGFFKIRKGTGESGIENFIWTGDPQ